MMNMDNVLNIVSQQTEEEFADSIARNTVILPVLGRLHFVRDREGQYYASVVLAYWVYGTVVPWFFILSPGYEDGVIPLPVYLGFLLVSALCIISFVRVSLTNPGRVPSYSESADPGSTWNKCRMCGRMRPPRAHHCRRCSQCVLKMDHHCPWINNCVGEDNHYLFVQLLFYAFLLGFYTFILVMCHFWVFPKCVSCDKEAFLVKHSVWFMYLAFFLSLNMMLMMGIQLGQQHFNILLDKTTLERMSGPHIIQPSELRKTYYSYREICGQGHYMFWLCPIGRRRPWLPQQAQHPV